MTRTNQPKGNVTQQLPQQPSKQDLVGTPSPAQRGSSIGNRTEQVFTPTEKVPATDLSKDILLPFPVRQLKKELGSDWKKKIINLSSRGKVELRCGPLINPQ
jgi:hypothetical protein